MLRRTSTHVYIPPHKALRRHIAHYTLFLPDGKGPAFLRLIPDASGCIVCARRSGGMDAPIFWGPTSRCVDVNNDVNSTPLCVFIEFRPGGAYAALRGLPLDKVRDARLPLAALDPPLSRALADLAEACPLPALPDRLDALLLARLDDSGDSSLMDALARHMALSGGNARARDLVRLTGYSERHLRRVCRERLGLGPKTFARVLRVNQACGRLRAGSPSLTALAQDLGYYDQAHFIHDFRAVCGVSPSGYGRNPAVFYKEEFK